MDLNIASTSSLPQPSALDLDKELACPICCDLFVGPVNFGCGHSFCGSCAHQWLKKEMKLVCPSCRAPSTTPPARLYVLESVIQEYFDHKVQNLRQEGRLSEARDMELEREEKVKLWAEQRALNESSSSSTPQLTPQPEPLPMPAIPQTQSHFAQQLTGFEAQYLSFYPHVPPLHIQGIINGSAIHHLPPPSSLAQHPTGLTLPHVHHHPTPPYPGYAAPTPVHQHAASGSSSNSSISGRSHPLAAGLRLAPTSPAHIPISAPGTLTSIRHITKPEFVRMRNLILTELDIVSNQISAQNIGELYSEAVNISLLRYQRRVISENSDINAELLCDREVRETYQQMIIQFRRVLAEKTDCNVSLLSDKEVIVKYNQLRASGQIS